MVACSRGLGKTFGFGVGCGGPFLMAHCEDIDSIWRSCQCNRI